MATINTDSQRIEELLTRGVEKIYPSKEELEKVLLGGKRLRIYQGFDPSGIQLHIGHMAGLRKLSQWQALGHEVIFLIGDGTGQAGDPSGKTRAREKHLSRAQLRQNAKDYVSQAGKIVRFTGDNPVRILYNGDWLNKLTLVDILNLADHFTLQQLEERDMFVERKKRGEPINFREFLYPLLQAYDSVAMNVDLELGGRDQTFNMLCGRQLVKEMRGKEKFVMTTPLLTDAQGQKIGKSEGNVIALTAPPNDLYGLIMNLGDDVIVKSLEYLTDISLKEVREIEEKIAGGANPMPYKKRLALEITALLNGRKDAEKAQASFEKVFQKKQTPEKIPSFALPLDQSLSLVEILTSAQLAPSRAEAKRLIEQGGVEVDGQVVSNAKYKIAGKKEIIIKVGKRRFLRIAPRK